MVVYLSGEVVGFSGGGEGIDEADLTLQLASGTFVNGVKDWIVFCDGRLLSITCSHFTTLLDWSFIL